MGGLEKPGTGRTRVDEGLDISTNRHDVLGNGIVKYVVKVKVGQLELVTDILRQTPIQTIRRARMYAHS